MSLLDALLLDGCPLNVWIAYRTDGVKGTGTLQDPLNGSTQALFDGIMRNLPTNVPVRVHLGPSPSTTPFLTQGYYDGASSGSGWRMRPGMKLIGAGRDVTRLKLVNDLAANQHHFAIGHELTDAGGTVATPVDYAEVADLTIDCNLQAQTNAVACGAVRLMGSHVRIRRVKAVNWGNKIASSPSLVLAVIVADPQTNYLGEYAGMEDCVAVQDQCHPVEV